MPQTVTILEASDVQSMIDAAVAPLEERITALENDNGGGGGGQSPSGIEMPTDVPSGWKVSIAEHFDLDCASKAEFDSKYPARKILRYPDNYPDTRKNQGKADGGYYTANITVAGSVLTAHMKVVNGVAQCMSLVPKATNDGKWGDSPGLIWEECSKFTYTDGFKSAHLSWPKSNDSTPDGEIDFPEFDADDDVCAFLHHQGATQGSDQKQFNTDVDPTQWHWYRTIWKMGEYVEFYCDGVLIAPRYTTRIPSTPMHLSLQNETWLSSAPVPANATGTVSTDWIRVLIPSNVTPSAEIQDFDWPRVSGNDFPGNLRDRRR